MIRSLPPISMGMPLEDRSNSPLPPIGHDISRPSSTSTQASAVRRYPQSGPQGHPTAGNHSIGVSLPGVSSLAAVAHPPQSPQPRSFNPVNQQSPGYPTASPSAASIAGQGNNPPVCQNCQTSTTPLWRRDEMGSVLCNACGLFLKLHGRPRPISLKTDVIKSRNRVKNSGQALKKAAKALMNGQQGNMTPEQSHRRVSNKSGSDRSNSPVSRTMTPSAPPPAHMDPIHFPPHHLTHSPSLPALHHFRQHSPGAASSAVSAGGDRHTEAPTTWDGLQHENAVLRTRVSELEVINGLFKGRIHELERAESANRGALDHSRARELELTKRLGDLERQVTELRRQTPPGSAPSSGIKRPAEESSHFPTPTELSPPYAKRSRLSDVFDAPSSRPVSA